LETHSQSAVNLVARVILNVILLKHAMTETVKIHVYTKSVAPMLFAAQGFIKPFARAFKITLEIPMTNADLMSVSETLIVQQHKSVKMKSVLILVIVPKMPSAILAITEESVIVFLTLLAIHINHLLDVHQFLSRSLRSQFVSLMVTVQASRLACIVNVSTPALKFIHALAMQNVL
jgi:hypothetical protein